MYTHPPAPGDDLVLPDPAEPTEEIPLPKLRGLEWPFDKGETLALALLYATPFIVRLLVKP
jgi:hypothetical protein